MIRNYFTNLTPWSSSRAWTVMRRVIPHTCPRPQLAQFTENKGKAEPKDMGSLSSEALSPLAMLFSGDQYPWKASIAPTLLNAIKGPAPASYTGFC